MTINKFLKIKINKLKNYYKKYIKIMVNNLLLISLI